MNWEAWEIPIGWTISDLTDIADVMMGQSPPGNTYNTEGLGLPFFQGKSEFGDDHPTVRKWCTAPTRIAEEGDILMSVRAPVGPTNVADQRCAVGRGLAIIRPKPGVPTSLVRYGIKFQEAEIASWGTGTTFTAINKEHFQRIRIPIPPAGYREQLAQVLEQAVMLQRITASHLGSARRTIKRLHQAILAAACSGRLTSDWRDRHSPADSAIALVERSMQLLAAHSPHQLRNYETLDPDWLVLPDSWQWATLANLADIRGGIQKQPKRTPKRNAYPYLRVANVQRGQLDLSEIHQFELQDGELEIYRLEPGDLLVVEGNGSASEIGRCALWNGEIANCVHQNHIIRVRCVEMEPRFVELYWNSPIGSREIASLAVTSAGLYSLSTKKIGSVLVPVAPLDEQREVVRRVHELLSIADRQKDRVEVAIERVERSSQAVLAKAFRGELSAIASEEQNIELAV